MIKKKSVEFFARTGMAMSHAERNQRDENTAECRELQTMERHHNNPARARDVALALCEEGAGARRSAENLAERSEQKQTRNEQPRRVDAASGLAVEHDHGLRAEEERLTMQAALERKRGGGVWWRPER